MNLRVENVKLTEDFGALAPNAPMPWACERDGSVRDAKGIEVCRTTPILAAVIVRAVNACAGYRAVPPKS